MRPTFPTYEQVKALDTLYEHTITEDWLDQNGHVNIQYYQTLYDLSGHSMLERLGIDESYFSEQKRGLFDLEHHVFYLSELHVGDRVAVHGIFLSRNHKRMHGMVFITNLTKQVLACTLEFTCSSANLETRRKQRISRKHCGSSGHHDRRRQRDRLGCPNLRHHVSLVQACFL